MKRFNGNTLKSIIVGFVITGFGSFIAKEVWMVKTLYEIKTDVAVIKNEGIDNLQEHIEINLKIDENTKLIGLNNRAIYKLKATIKQ